MPEKAWFGYLISTSATKRFGEFGARVVFHKNDVAKNYIFAPTGPTEGLHFVQLKWIVAAYNTDGAVFGRTLKGCMCRRYPFCDGICCKPKWKRPYCHVMSEACEGSPTGIFDF